MISSTTSGEAGVGGGGVRGLGTLINVVAVVAGSSLGAVLGGRLPGRVRDIVTDGLGLLTFVLGISMAVKTQSFMIVMASIFLGGIVGELLRIERALERLGDYFQARLAASSSTFSTGFVTASLVFCVGPMAILGSIDDGLRGNVQLLVVKSVLDGFAALAFATTLGWGVGLSALSVFVYQGSLTVAAGFVARVLSEPMITEMTATGGLLVLAIGLRLLHLREVKVANLLPALFFAPALVALVDAVRGLL
ncbi:MAG: DUF554 domain-containing protein [Actinobacteria bacterium]|nr:DUF554 domain-containing protein [Actinomycetota bacterium]